jgi:poly(A) polymerase
MLTRNEKVGPSALRRFIREVGGELVDAVLDLAEADELGNYPVQNLVPDLKKDIEALKVHVEKAEELPVDGLDIQRILGIKPGRQVGEAMKFLRDKKFDIEQVGGEMTEKDAEKLLREKFL